MVKGSRDPLGFQVLWQAAGREMIPHLSTVSNSIRDFQVISMADHCRRNFQIAEQDYLSFFLCFEQLMGYTRFFQSDGNDSFNGIDKVRKIMAGDKSELSLSVNGNDQLLSNQKSYGIWGKYNRPYTDLALSADNRFIKAQNNKLRSNNELYTILEKLAKKRGGPLTVNRKIIEQLGTVFNPPGGNERACFIQYLLTDHSHGELFRLTSDYPSLTGLSFYEQLNYLKNSTTDLRFAGQVELLTNTERTLSPLNRIFRYLQEKSFWTFEAMDNDELINFWSKGSPLTGEADLPFKLPELLKLNNRDLVSGLVKLNSEVCNRRGSEPWISLSSSGLEVNHFEGAFTDTDYNPQSDNDYSYFLHTWFSIYRQLN
jgi:hypothetical protein